MQKPRAATKKDHKPIVLKEKASSADVKDDFVDESPVPESEIIDKYVFFKSDGKVYKVELDKILLLEASSNYINLYHFEEFIELVEIEREDEDDDNNRGKTKPYEKKIKKVLRTTSFKEVSEELLRVTLAQAIKILPPKQFIRLSRTYVVSIKYLEYFTPNTASVAGLGIEYHPSKKHYKQLLKRLRLLSSQ